jgi:hypothetical protein
MKISYRSLVERRIGLKEISPSAINGPRRAAASAQSNAPFELVPKDVDELGTNTGKLRPDQGADAAAAGRWKRLKVGGASNC